MLMPTSSEFVALCRSQVTLLAQALGASLSVVYLTEEFVEDTQPRLIPVAAYPDLSVASENANRLALMPDAQSPSKNPFMLPHEATKHHDASQGRFESSALMQPRQLVLPLVHDGLVLGLLVTERDDRAWSSWERSQVDRIADTLSLACVLDQRAQWLDQSQQQNQLAQQQQHDVMDNLLHQLRSPLTALRTFGKLLMKRLAPSDPNREIADSIVQQSDRLQELLQQFDEAIDLGTVDLLPAEDLSSDADRPIPLLPAGVLTGSNLELAVCSVTEILQPLIVSASAIAQEKGLTLKTDIPNTLPPVFANTGALREVLSNLIDNALKYTPRGGEVHIQGNQPTREHVAVWVSDTGPGIPREDLPHLFERHYRGVQAQGEIPGTGLGLAIARRLVEQMQGAIQVFSPAKNDGWISEADPPSNAKGTTFVVELRAV
jgi:signal transduction histidine kinase